jgi:hypothetical protein
MTRLPFAAIVALAATLAAAPAASASPPANDAYMAATALNQPGSEMPRDTVTSPPADTTEATLQTDLLSPPAGGGPPEPDACDGTPLDRTTWYRFFPDVSGRITISAVGLDTVIGLVPFASAAAPLPQGYTCANLRDDTIETLTAAVQARTGYAVQVGGAQGAAGILQVSFTFLPDRDGDGVTDEQDGCPRTPGTAGGCPPKIVARVAYKYDGSARGVRFRYLRVSDAPSGARVDVRCSRGCRHQRLTVRAAHTELTSFRRRFMPVGAAIEVRVTKPGQIGTYTRFTVSAGNVTSTDRCLPPGSSKPRRTCK